MATPYRVVIRGGVWVRTIASMVRPTDRSIQGTFLPNPLRDRVSIGVHSHRCANTRVCEVPVESVKDGIKPGKIANECSVAI